MAPSDRLAPDYAGTMVGSAPPRKSTHDAALRRAFHYEACRIDTVHRCTVFFDLSTFYERIEHTALVDAVAKANFPSVAFAPCAESGMLQGLGPGCLGK